MTQPQHVNVDRAGERRDFAAHGHALLAAAGGMAVMKGTFEPGWRWSKDVAPMAGTELCQTRHLGYVISGRMHVVMADGSEHEIGPGDLFDLPAGHDAYVVGDEACVMVDTSPDAVRYATAGTSPAGVAPQEDRYLSLVRRGYEAFNRGDMKTLTTLLSHDVIQHVPGNSQVSGEFKGIDAVLGMYARLGELTDGTLRVDLVDVHGDGRGHVAAIHQMSGTRNGVRRVARGSLIFTFVGDKVLDVLQLSPDIAGEDAFFG